MTNLEKIDQYSVDITRDEDEGFVARYKELGHSASGFGLTPEAAFADLKNAAQSIVEVFPEEDLPDPAIIPEWEDVSGRVTLRMPKNLHFQLNQLAHMEGVSLNSLLTDILRSGATVLASGNIFGVASVQPVIIPLLAANQKGKSQPGKQKTAVAREARKKYPSGS